ncbi:MAG TPA: ABC transporter substrate-binding protein, partial [Thermoanaerobaculia bacterium]|nr:ABC transporter substrate-binding protein [Thermoanaerobaculia bacterium]
GTPLTAEAAAASLRNSNLLRAKAEVEACQGRVVFTLASANPRFELTLTNANCSIVLEKEGCLLGTGDFRFECEDSGAARCVRLVPNRWRTGGDPVDAIEFVVLEADENGIPRALVDALRREEVDLTTCLSPFDLERARLDGSLQRVTQPSNSTGILFFNTQRDALASARVRRAIAMCLDIEEIVERALGHHAPSHVATSLLPPMMRRSAARFPSDRAQGLALLEELRFRPRSLSLLVPWAPRPYLPKPHAVARAIQSQLAEIGIDTQLLETHSGHEYFGDLAEGRYDMALAGWIADTPDPADFLEALLYSKMTDSRIHANYSRWQHEPTDEAILAFRQQPSDDNRKAIESLLLTEAPLVPLMYGQPLVVHSPRLRNVRCTAAGVVCLSAVSVS